MENDITIDVEQIYENYAKLTEEEKDIIRVLMNGPARSIIAKVFGEEFERALGVFQSTSSKKKKGLASRII
tara:strand:- start:262 stop:474 length:213 start_codon:yes stop_codon:yes gene_type:complete